MTHSLNTAHLLYGVLGLMLFLGTGQYMQHVAEVPALTDSERLMYRSGHLYIMFAFAANVFWSFRAAPTAIPNPLAWLCSLMLAVAPIAATFSFFQEIGSVELDRPIASLSLVLVFIAASLAAIGRGWAQWRGE